MTAHISDAMIGTTQRVLVYAPSKRDPDELAARTDNNRVVNFKAEPHLVGQMIDVRITASRVTTLRGELA